MTASINIDIDVNGTEFAAFADKFKQFKENLDKTPDAWRKIASNSKALESTLETMSATMLQQMELTEKIANATIRTRQASEATSNAWQRMVLSTAGVATNIANATGSLLKWAGVTSIISGLAGFAGSAFGMSHLASGVSGNRSAALGISTDYGSRRSFMLNYERFGDPGGTLGRVNNAMHDAAGVKALLGLGLSESDLKGDAASVSVKAIDALRRKTRGMNPQFLQDYLTSSHAGEIFSLQEAQRYGNVSDAEMNSVKSNHAKDSRRFSLGDKEQSDWQNLRTQMNTATARIETLFIKTLGNLAPALTETSKAFISLVDRVLDKYEKPVNEWLKKLGENLEWLAKHIDTKEFREQVSSFVRGVKDIAVGIADFLTGLVSMAKKFGFISEAEAHGYEGGSGGRGLGVGLRGGGSGGAGGAASTGGSSAEARAGAAGGSGRFQDALARIESSNKNIFSRTDPDTAGPGTRSQGYFQIGVPTWQDFAGKAGVDLGKYPTPMSAPREVQERVANAIPFGRFGPRTRRMLEQQFGFGEGEKKRSIGELGARYNAPPPAVANYTPNRKTTVSIRPQPGAGVFTLSGASAGP